MMYEEKEDADEKEAGSGYHGLKLAGKVKASCVAICTMV